MRSSSHLDSGYAGSRGSDARSSDSRSSDSRRTNTTRSGVGRRCGAVAMAGALLAAVAACGGSDRQFAGFVREPAPVVDTVELPDLSQQGAPFAMRAPEGELLVVYFGFTNCPDVCPTTLADLRSALRRLDPADAERVSLALVSVDPARDTPVLVDYAQTFVDGAHALATTDDAVLRQAAEPFGATYLVETAEDGSVEVAHSAQMYVVDDQGRLLLTWQFGIAAEDLAADLEQLLDQQEA